MSPRPPLLLVLALVATSCATEELEGQRHAASQPDRLACTGYPEPRVFLEAQSWWLPTPGKSTNAFGHVHVGTCFPLDQTLRGTVDFDIRIILHNNPGTLHRIRTHIAGDGFNETTGGFANLGKTCPDDQTCAWWFHTTMDTRVARYDGRQEFRFLTTVREPDGQELHVSTGWQAYLDNGKEDNDYRRPNFYEGRGWYTGANYIVSQLRSAFPFKALSGTWRPTVGLKHGSGGIPVTHHSVHVDPKFHANDRGIVIRDASGRFQDDVSIDTTKLADGKHRLVLKADADCQSGNCGTENDGQRVSGIFVIPFVVDNGKSQTPSDGGGAPGADAGVAEADAGSAGPDSSSGQSDAGTAQADSGSSSAGDASTQRLIAQSDTYVRGGAYADQAYGGSTRLRVKDASDRYTRISYVRFSLAGIKSASHAELSLYVRRLSNGTPVTVSASGAADESWNETTMTWNTRPAISGAAVASRSLSSAQSWVTLDVTSVVRAALKAAATTVTIVVDSHAHENRMAEFSSREGSHPPTLAITP